MKIIDVITSRLLLIFPEISGKFTTVFIHCGIADGFSEFYVTFIIELGDSAERLESKFD